MTIKYFADCGGQLVEIAYGQKCPLCGDQHRARRIEYATKPSRHACNAKCLTATGPHCECACGGKNHGAGFTMPGNLFAA